MTSLNSQLDGLEREVIDTIADSRDRLIELTSELIAFDTTAREATDPPREEYAMQQCLAERLRTAGAAIELWEPEASELGDGRQVPEGIGFEGRPQLAATFRGAGGGPSLLLNGHIDVVTPEPVAQWTSDPWRAEVRGDLLYGRGACDMKGGIACIVVAAETLAHLGVNLAGDLVVCTNTDEESSGAGSLAAVTHGVRADAGICPEDTNGELWIACRGSQSFTVTVSGRAGHAEMKQPDWREGGAVNAIEKGQIVLEAIRALQEHWRERPDQRHAHLTPGSIVPTLIRGGEWIVSYPAACDITANVNYVPASADADGYGAAVAAEIERWIVHATSDDAWLREHPPSFRWGPDLPPFEVSTDHPIVATVGDAARAAGDQPRVAWLDSWFDAASFARAGTVMIGYGPGAGGAHGVDEHVAVRDLVTCAQTLALSAMRWCRLGS